MFPSKLYFRSIMLDNFMFIKYYTIIECDIGCIIND